MSDMSSRVEFVYMTQQTVFVFGTSWTKWALKSCLLPTFKPDVSFECILTRIASPTLLTIQQLSWQCRNTPSLPTKQRI